MDKHNVLMHVHILTKVRDQKRGDWVMYKAIQTQGCMFAHNYNKGMELMWEVRLTCIHALMHLHIVTQVRDQKMGDWDMQREPHRGTHKYVKGVE